LVSTPSAGLWEPRFYLEPAATLDVDIFVTLPTSPGSNLLSLPSPIHDYLKARSFKVEQEHVIIGD
jgi:hypothetical protein